MNAPKPGCGVRALYHYYRQLRPTPAAEALRMARYHEDTSTSDLWDVKPC